MNQLSTIVLGVGFLTASALQALLFVALASDICDTYDCVLSFGSGLTIGGIVLCLLTGLALFSVEPPSKRKKQATPGEVAVPPAETGDSDTLEHHDDEEEPHEEEHDPEAGSDMAVQEMEDVPLDEATKKE
jgi:hypothetical protein